MQRWDGWSGGQNPEHDSAFKDSRNVSHSSHVIVDRMRIRKKKNVVVKRIFCQKMSYIKTLS